LATQTNALSLQEQVILILDEENRELHRKTQILSENLKQIAAELDYGKRENRSSVATFYDR